VNKRTILALALFAAPAAVLAVHVARAGNAPNAPANSFQLLTGFSAKETCSCAFVVEQADDYCTTFGQQPGYNVTIAIDHTAKTVTSTFALAKRTARFADGVGCTLDGF
jgi:hypothetical protein